MTDQYKWLKCKLTANEDNSRRKLFVDGSSELTNDEVEKINLATTLLMEIIRTSPFARLQDCHIAFKKAIAEASISMREKRSKPQDLYSLSSLLDNFLSAFRAFDDRMSHDLSRRYGKTSLPYKTFKDALSFEFDNTFEYRFTYHLRNYSQHAGNPITNIRANARLENGVVISECIPTFDSKALLERYKEWHSKVKADLAEINGEFSVEITVDMAMASCWQAYCKLLQSIEKEIEAAANLILSYDYIEKNEYPVLVKMQKTPNQKDATNLMLETQNIETGVARLAIELLKRSREVTQSSQLSF